MTEKSYFWDGVVTGDSSIAPYNAEEFNTWMFSSLLANDRTEGYVVPGYLNDLRVKSAGTTTHSIIVDSGASCFNNCLYILDTALSFRISRVTASYYRRDIVVLRIDFNAQKARLAVVEGNAALGPDLALAPTPVRTAAVYEIILANIFLDGYLTYVDDGYVYDARKFIYNIFLKTAYNEEAPNLVRNSEWLAYSRDVVTEDHPDEWVTVVNGTNLPRVATTKSSGRGDWGVNFAIGTYAQWIAVSGKTFTLRAFLDNTDPANLPDTIIGLQAYRSNGELSAVSKEQHYIGTNTNDVEVSFTITFPEDDITKLYVYIEQNELFTSPVIYISQVIVLPGYHAGGFRAIPEVIPISDAIADASWAATAKSTGTTTINFGASFSALIKNFTRAVILRLRGRDSGSAAAANCYLRALGYAAPYNAVYGSLEIAGITNDVWRETQAIVPVDQIYFGTGVAGAQLRLEVLATGVGTFDATVEVVGIIV